MTALNQDISDPSPMTVPTIYEDSGVYLYPWNSSPIMIFQDFFGLTGVGGGSSGGGGGGTLSMPLPFAPMKVS